MRRGPGWVRTSAVPRPESPASGFAMQLTVSFDHRSPKRFVVTLATATSFMSLASSRARSVSLPSSSPILNPIAPVAGRVHPGADRDDAPERPLASGDRRHALVVDPVLEVDHHAVRLLEVLDAQRRRPLRVVGLDADEDRVEGLGDRLGLVDVERLDADRVVAAGPAEAEAAFPHGLHVLGPLIDERHVVPGLGEHPPDDAPDSSGPDDSDSHWHGSPPFRPSMIT